MEGTLFEGKPLEIYQNIITFDCYGRKEAKMICFRSIVTLSLFWGGDTIRSWIRREYDIFCEPVFPGCSDPEGTVFKILCRKVDSMIWYVLGDPTNS